MNRGEVLEFEYTRRTVPKDSLGVLDDICKDLFSLRTDIKTFPAIRNFVNRAELGVGIVGERIGNLGINSQNKVYAFSFAFFTRSRAKSSLSSSQIEIPILPPMALVKV